MPSVTPVEIAQVEAFLDAHEAERMEGYLAFLRIPSISSAT